MKLLEGKTVVITGATRGIGKGISNVFVDQGANVAFTFLSSEKQARSIENELSVHGSMVKGYKSNASDFNESTELIQSILDDFGNIDVLVNNAGITKDNLLMRLSEEDYDSVMNVNMKSVFNMTKAVLRPMLKQRKGSIINMSSVVGIKGNAGQTNYSASKSAILGFTKSTALELGSRNIRCNAIAPGFIETEMTNSLSDDQINEWRNSIPLKRGGNPEDVANTALFLASDMSSYVTGQVINVCGGMLT